MKNSLSSPSITNRNNQFNTKIHKLLLHDMNQSESKKKVISKIKKIIKTENTLYNKNFDFNYGKEYHKVRDQLNAFNKNNTTKKNLILYLRNENKKFKKIFQTNTKEFKTLSFNSLNKQKNLKKTLSLLINNNNENNIFIESPLLMSNNKDINLYYSHYDENNDNVYKDKNTHIPIIDEENDESIKFSNKLLDTLNHSNFRKRSNISYSDSPSKSPKSENKKDDYFSNYFYKSRNNHKNLLKENMELKKYNNSIKKLLDELYRSKRHSTKFTSKDNHFDQIKNIRNSNFNVNYRFHLNLDNKENDDKNRKINKKYSMVPLFKSPRKPKTSTSIFEKLFKDILKHKHGKERNVSHIETIYEDIQKMKKKFLSYDVDKRMNLHNFGYVNLKSKNNNLYENESNKNKIIRNLDFELFWRFHNYKNFK